MKIREFLVTLFILLNVKYGPFHFKLSRNKLSHVSILSYQVISYHAFFPCFIGALSVNNYILCRVYFKSLFTMLTN